MRKQLLSMMLVFTMLATLFAAALPVSAAEESEQTTSMLQITSDITVSELDTTEITGSTGQTYVAYDWFIYGECDMIINHPDMGLENQEYSGTFMNVSMRWFEPDYVIEYSDNQETEPWEPGNTYDAKIVLRSLASGEPVDVETIDVRVTVEGLNIKSISAEDYSWAPYTPKKPVINVTYKDGTTSNDVSGVGIYYDDEWPTEPGTYELKMSALNGKHSFTIKLTVVKIVSVTAKPLTYSELENADIEFTATYENGFTYTWLDLDTPLPREVGEYTIEVGVFNDTFTVPVSVTVTAAPTTGVWAEGFTWDYDKLTKTLYINGEGMLPAPTNYGYKGLPIKNIVIEDGIEGFEQWALMQLSDGEYESLIFPSTIKSFPALGIFGSYTTVNNVIFCEGISNITHLPFVIPGYGAQVENIYVPESVELIDVYSLVASAGGCGSSVVNLYYAGTEEQWTAITAQPTLYVTLRNLYNTDGSLELFELEGYLFPTNFNNYIDELRTYEMMGLHFYEYQSNYEITVTWVDEDGKVIEAENVVIGGNVTKNPDVPAKEGYTGKWSTAGTDVTAPIVIAPVYTVNTYTVTWVDENGNTVETETVEYGKDATKTPAVPAKVGYTGKWSTQATDVKADMTIKPEYTEQITVENGTANIPDNVVDVEEGKDVVIDVTDVTDKDETTEVKVDKVVIGSTTVDKITNANTNVEIKLPDATVSFDKEAIGSIGEQAGDKDVTIVAKEVEKETLTDEQKVSLEEKEVHAVLNLEAYAGENKLTEFGGGKVTISVPFELPEGKAGSDFLVAYIADDGTMTVMPTSYANGALTFETTHFSSYVVLEVENSDAPDTGDSTAIALFVMLMAVCGIGLTACVAKRKTF